MPSLLEITRQISTIVPSKWFVDIHHFADCIGISVDKVSWFIQCIEDGGYKSDVDGCWHPNLVGVGVVVLLYVVME
jgi:tRNA G26 N,N-dimethylase Trm1